MRATLLTSMFVLGLGISAASGQDTTPEKPKTDSTQTRREERVARRDVRQDARQDDRKESRDDRQENRDERQDARDTKQDTRDREVRQENRQERREQIRERIQAQANQDGRRPIDTIFTLVDRIVDATASPDVANASLPQVQETYALLRQFDRDNNGQITQEELVAGQQMAHQQRTAATLQRLDTNKDGKISRDEATSGQFVGSFEQSDANKDGFIDRDELTATHTAMRLQPGIRRDGQGANTVPPTVVVPNPAQPKD